MTLTLRIILIVVSVLTCVLVLRKIRKSQLNVADSLFWIFLSVVLVFISVFSNVVSFFTELIGIESPSNFVFLAMIFVVIIKLFSLSVKTAAQKERLTALIQQVALKQKELDEKIAKLESTEQQAKDKKSEE